LLPDVLCKKYPCIYLTAANKYRLVTAASRLITTAFTAFTVTILLLYQLQQAAVCESSKKK
jgi:hypothetical protein